MAAYYIVLSLLGLLFACCTILDYATMKEFLAEGGPIELASAILHLVCFALVVLRGGASFVKRYPYFAVMPLVFAMRELDFDKRFTTTGIFKSRFYLRPDVPLHEKLIGALVILTLAVLVIMMARRHTRDFIAALRQRSALAVGAALTIALCVSSKFLDGLERKCRDLGFQLNELIARYSSPLEEILELGIPIIMILAFSHYFSRQSRSSESATIAR